MKKSENGSKAKFLYSLLKVLKSISGELLIGICWSSRLLGVFMMKMCVVISLTSFGNWKYECVMNFREIFSFHPLINDCWMKLFILIISAIISSNDIFFFVDCTLQFCCRPLSCHLSILWKTLDPWDVLDQPDELFISLKKSVSKSFLAFVLSLVFVSM